MALAVEVTGKTDVGCVRTNNEDNFGYDSRYGIYVVCDGMGGQAAGEVASKIGVDVLLNYFREAAQSGEYQPVGKRFPGVSANSQALHSGIQLANDVLLMTSDGLTKYVRDEEILKIVSSAAMLEEACDSLIDAARRRGGDDNITCLLVRIVERPWYKSIFQKWFSGGPQWQNSI